MGNLTQIIPQHQLTKNNADYVFDLLTREFQELYIVQSEYGVHVYKNKTQLFLITDIYFDGECHLLDEPNLDYLSRLKKIMPITMTYGVEFFTAIPHNRNDIEKFLHNYFKAYTFDEGIAEYKNPNNKWVTYE